MPDSIKTIVLSALEDVKANDIQVLDVSGLTDVTDTMVVASGTSNRHVKSLAENVMREAKQQGIPALGAEGLENGEWVLVDFGDVVLHAMLPAAREFYDLERLWSASGPSGDALETPNDTP